MKHETQMSNHLTITQLLCEQISIIPNLSKWILEWQNRLENSVPQQEVGNSTNEKVWKRRREMNTSVKSEESSRDNGSPPPRRQNSSPRPTLFLYVTSDRALLSTQKDELYSLSLWKLCFLMAVYTRISPGPSMFFHTISTSPRLHFCLLYTCPPNSSIKTQFHFHPYHQVSISLSP